MVYPNSESCITEFFIGDIDLNEGCSMFSLRADYYFIHSSIFSKVVVVAQQLGLWKKYVWIVVLARESTDRD